MIYNSTMNSVHQYGKGCWVLRYWISVWNFTLCEKSCVNAFWLYAESGREELNPHREKQRYLWFKVRYHVFVKLLPRGFLKLNNSSKERERYGNARKLSLTYHEKIVYMWSKLLNENYRHQKCVEECISENSSCSNSTNFNSLKQD
jgi:hypothetical protein